MIKGSDYNHLPHIKNGGPSAKNGFQIEQYWGIKKIYNLYSQQVCDFFVIFDNYCDIEYGFINGTTISFDQVKTEGLSEALAVSRKKLVNAGDSGHSIFSELVRFGEGECVEKVSLVWNYPYRVFGGAPIKNSFDFNALPQEEKNFISSSIKKEIGQDITWSKYSFEYFPIENSTARKQMVGETAEFLEGIKGNKTPYPDMFLSCLESRVRDCSSAAISKTGIEGAIQTKGITRSSFDQLLQTYQNSISVKKESVYDYFNENNSRFSPRKKRLLREKIISAETEINKNGIYNRIFRAIKCRLNSSDKLYEMPTCDLFAKASFLFQDLKREGLDDDDLTALTIIACKRIEEGN